MLTDMVKDQEKMINDLLNNLTSISQYLYGDKMEEEKNERGANFLAETMSLNCRKLEICCQTVNAIKDFVIGGNK